MSLTIGAFQPYGGYYGIQPQAGSVKNTGGAEKNAPRGETPSGRM